MRINENIKKCVAYLQFKMADGSYKYAGTCFFIAFEKQQNNIGCVITAKHVLEGVRKHGLDEIFIKLNLVNGKTDTICTKINT
ncbi:MAG: hypothetical protein Q7V63_01575 [Gammaproteobacteria bacterium]|nr:hypothetical protein [Gammaproteobacteria bacterium]